MSDTPFFSIIVPVYNVKDFIAETVGGILRQTCGDFEIILVDDGSTDGSGELCRKMAEEDCRIRLIQKENGGVSSARNTGLDYARGQYISFVDGDDLLQANTLEQVRQIADAHCSDVICTDFVSVPEDYRLGTTTNSLKEAKVVDKQALISKKLLDDIIPCVANFYRRSLLEEHQIRFCRQLYYVEDALFFFTCVTKAQGNIMYLEEPMYLYRQREGSAVHTQSPKYYKIKTEHDGWIMIADLLANQDAQIQEMLKQRFRKIRYRLLFTFIEAYDADWESLSGQEQNDILAFVRKYKWIARAYDENGAISRGKRGIFTAYLFAFSPTVYSVLRKFLKKQG